MPGCLPLFPGILGVFRLGQDVFHDEPNPLEVLGHLRVDAILAFASAALTPAYHTCHKPCIFVFGDMRTTAVTLTRILFQLVVAGTEHAKGDVELGGLFTDGTVYIGHAESLQDSGLETTLRETTKSTHHAVVFLHEHTLCKVVLGEACWEDVPGESNGLHKLDEGNVVVEGVGLIFRMHQYLFNGMFHFLPASNQCICFTC